MTGMERNHLAHSEFGSQVARSGSLLTIRPMVAVAQGAGKQLDAMSYRFLFRVLCARQAVNAVRAGMADERV